jgi:hypothetical protein
MHNYIYNWSDGLPSKLGEEVAHLKNEGEEGTSSTNGRGGMAISYVTTSAHDLGWGRGAAPIVDLFHMQSFLGVLPVIDIYIIYNILYISFL